jgi:hypothetical protein
VDSWQEDAWLWARPREHHHDSAGMASPAPAPQRVQTSASISAATGSSVGQSQEHSYMTAGWAEVRVCVDGTGKLVQDPTIGQPSADPAFDAAAIKGARSGSGSYRPSTASVGAAAGCLELSIKPEQK